MALRYVFTLLIVVSVTSILIILSQDYSARPSSQPRWMSFSGKDIFGGQDKLFNGSFWCWGEKENLNATPAVLPSTLQAKTSEEPKSNLAATIKYDQTTASIHKAVAETPMPLLFAKNFTKLPQWDFEDVYNQDAPPRQITCAQSLRYSKDESFKKAFLPNIRLFLHKDNINMSEWNRLSHFNNPFGFMGYRYDDVMAAVKLIPKPKEPLFLSKDSDGCVHCAVVGNAGILYGSKKGREIDSHDYIFRMNAAITKGFEEDVGNRTSVYVHTAHSITSALYFYEKYGFKHVPNDKGIIYVMIPEGLRDFVWLESLLKGEKISAKDYHNKRPRDYYGGQYNETRFYVLHQDFLRYVRNRFLRSNRLNKPSWAIVRPSNGAFTLFFALHVCDTVSAYGFMTDDHIKYSNYYFQTAVKTKVIFYINHDYILEKNMWKTLHESKIISLSQRTDSVTEKPKPQRHAENGSTSVKT